MGLNQSWLAFKGMTADEACTAFGAQRTGEFADKYGSDLMGTALQGWYLIIVDDRGKYEMAALDFAEYEKLPVEVLSFRISEIVGLYCLESWVAGDLRWRVRYDSNQRMELVTEGDVPSNLTEIRAQLEGERIQFATKFPRSGKGAYDTAAPEELGKALIGFRHDEADYSSNFEILEKPNYWLSEQQSTTPDLGKPPDLSGPAGRSLYRGPSRPWWQFW